MQEIVVACVQLRIRLPQDREELEQHLLRFGNLAQTKRARLLIFPQYSGLMAAALVTTGARSGLLRQADQARRSNASFWSRTQARLAGGAASVLGADFGKALEGALIQRPDEVREAVTSLFSSIARHHGMTVVAGSAYLQDADGAVRHIALVFGPDGQQLGAQAAVTLRRDENPLVEAGKTWQAIDTPVGRLGILLGYDMFYPEAGRALAYAGAEALIGLGATTRPAVVARQRHGLLARVEDNQLFGAMSFAVGYNPFTPADQEPYLGRSLLAAPISLSQRNTNVLVEMGTDSTEGLITAEWNYETLRTLWAEDDPPIRSAMPVASFGPALSVLYNSGLTISRTLQIEAKPPAKTIGMYTPHEALPEPLPVPEDESALDEPQTEHPVADDYIHPHQREQGDDSTSS
ncbi:MAG: hypothetical protein H6649_08125 [Caldilineae bacterium]|nr:hypothetical protein [Caldilineae bacterium]